MNCQNTTTLNYITNFAPELFLRSTLGTFEKRLPRNDIETLCRISFACKDLYKKVNACWKMFMQQSEYISQFFVDLQDSEDPKDALIKWYPTIKWGLVDIERWKSVDIEKWKSVDIEKWSQTQPEIEKEVLSGSTEQCIMPNHLGNTALWLVSPNRDALYSIDLKTKETYKKTLNIKLKPVSSCIPCMVTDGNWIAVCCDIIGRGAKEIAIINDMGMLTRKIENIGEVLQLERNEEFLYVLCYISGENKLLKYNSNDWNEPPKEFCLPKDTKFVHKFCLFHDEIIFFASLISKTNQLIVVQRSELFLKTDPSLIKKDCPYHSLLKVCGKELFSINLIQDYNNTTITLNRIYIENSTINIKELRTLPIIFRDIWGFHVQLDKIFILKGCLSFCTILCYDLTEGELLKEFTPDNMSCLGTNFLPQFVVSTPERIQMLYNSTKLTANRPGFCDLTTTLYTLVYKKLLK